mmetsp:Transcript_23646/g.35779  ORF Transcript_23646/g.35779 Transcript_23646/m.35779 type:complete len:341 (-) Transcript_23646:162-1184(-)
MFSSKYIVTSIFFLLSLATSNAGTFGTRAVFAVPRGGGLFGGKNDEVTKTDAPDGLPEYPAMTKEEVEAWLDHIPVFGVTDDKGQGVVLRPDNDTSVLYFFISPIMANNTMNQLKATSPDMDLRVSAFSLGKIWFSMLGDGARKEVILKAPGSEEGSPSSGVEYRLVPDTRDLLGARMLLTMNPEDQEKLKEKGEMTPEIAQEAIQKAMTESPKFNATYNEIPVFLISQMRMQKPGDEGGEPVQLLPMYFSLQNMVSTWQQFMSQAPADVQGTEPAINLMSLHEMIDLMQKDCPIDFRNVLLIPSTPVEAGSASDAATAAGGTPSVKPMNSMGGSTLGDL